jgi:hypothetical protein
VAFDGGLVVVAGLGVQDDLGFQPEDVVGHDGQLGPDELGVSGQLGSKLRRCSAAPSACQAKSPTPPAARSPMGTSHLSRGFVCS